MNISFDKIIPRIRNQRDKNQQIVKLSIYKTIYECTVLETNMYTNITYKSDRNQMECSSDCSQLTGTCSVENFVLSTLPSIRQKLLIQIDH